MIDHKQHFAKNDFDMQATKEIEVQEEDGTWREAVLYPYKHGKEIVLWFGEEEYEGLGGGYRVVDGVIYDGDGEEIPYRLRGEEGQAEAEQVTCSPLPCSPHQKISCKQKRLNGKLKIELKGNSQVLVQTCHSFLANFG